MPGLTPFLDSLTLPAYYCSNCGFWQRYFTTPPDCPLCRDSRHVLPVDGWRFLNFETAQNAYPMHWRELEAGIWEFWNDPVDGIGAHSYLVTTPAGNLLFEGAAVFTADALAHIESLGGVAVAAASHPHTYGALWQIQEHFEPELALHPGDQRWWAALCVTWPFDESLEVLPGVTLYHTGVHFDGHLVAHVVDPGILMCGDALKFELAANDDRQATSISTHKAYVRAVPNTPDECRRYREVFAKLDFGQTWTPFEPAANAGRSRVLALLDSLIATRPHPHQVSFTDLDTRGYTPALTEQPLTETNP